MKNEKVMVVEVLNPRKGETREYSIEYPWSRGLFAKTRDLNVIKINFRGPTCESTPPGLRVQYFKTLGLNS